MNKKTLHSLPASPGCYLFKDAEKTVIYVGKAKNIKKRVSSYFQKQDHDLKTTLLVENIASVDFIATKTEVEAFLLENRLIKKHYPRYNIDLKDSRRYAYLRLTDDAIPWIETVRKREGKGKFYGPFVWGRNRKAVLQILSRQFGILTSPPSPRRRKSIDLAAYKENLAKAHQLLRGKVDPLIQSLEKQMAAASKKQFYEYALTLRNQINALESLKERQHIELSRRVDAHVIHYIATGDTVKLMLFSVSRGILEDKQEFEFPHNENFLEEFLVRFYEKNFIPDEIVVPDAVSPVLEDFLTRLRGKAVNVFVPERGEKKALLGIVKKNVELHYMKEEAALRDLQKAVKLSEIPRVIECFDISHLGGTHTTASMVSFLDGVPDKSNYRRFRIRAQTEGDDFLAMQEVVRRRYRKLRDENLAYPDLIVIDGGIGQLGAAMTVLKELGLRIPVISLAKRFEEIYVPGKRRPLKLSKRRESLKLLMRVRDEAHRFAVKYNRVLRRKGLLEG